MRVWHSAWSWLKEIVAEDSVAGNTFTGMFTRLTLRNPFQVGRAGMHGVYRFCTATSSGGWKGPRGSEGLVRAGSRRKYLDQNELRASVQTESPSSRAPRSSPAPPM